MAALPRYDELPTVEKTGEVHAWNAWRASDELGTINALTIDRIAAAAVLGRERAVLKLTLPRSEPNPGLFRKRTGYTWYGERTAGVGRADSTSNLFLLSSQWDGLRHIRHRTAGYDGGRDDADLDASALGIDVLAHQGVVSRGVLIDVATAAAARGLEPDDRWALDGPTVQSIADERGFELPPGDILALATGGIAWYLSLSPERRQQMVGFVGLAPGGLARSGLAGHVATAEWLWNHEVAAVVVDNPAFEAYPVARAECFLHRRLIPLLGMPLGEVWWLEDLAERCRAPSHYELLFISVPLHLPGGVGSPANAIAAL